MRGVRPMLFGTATIIGGGFTVVHDLLYYSVGYGPNTEVALFGMMVGFAFVTLGFLYGVFADAEAAMEGE